jgi:hypothetical protein
MTDPASPGAAPSYCSTVLPPLAAFVAAGLLAPLYSDEPFEIGLTAWQAVVLWPIGLLVVGAPVLVLLGVRTAWMVRLGQAAIGVVGVASMVAVARSDDAQAGLAFMWGPLLGSGAAAAVLAADVWLRRARRGGRR